MLVLPQPPKPEPLSESASTSLTATDKHRLLTAAAGTKLSQAAILRAALNAHLAALGY